MTEIFLDGAWRDGAGAIDAADRGLLLGDGVFDTALVLNGTVFRRAAHLDRLDAALARLSIGVERARIEAAMDALAARAGDGSLRLTVTRGPGPRGLAPPPQPRPTLLGTCAPLAPASVFAPLRLALAGARRNEFSPLSSLKVPAYLDAVLAAQEAKAAGADEALFLNTAGRLACSALANVFLATPEGIATPPLSEGVLPGVMRGFVLAAARGLGLSATERPISLAEAEAGELFLTNSLRLLAPAAIGRAPAPPSRGPRRLMDAIRVALAAECGPPPASMRAPTR